MGSRKKVLMTARDPGAVGHISEIAWAFGRSGNFEVVLAASGRAFEMLVALGHTTRHFKCPDGSESISNAGESSALLASAVELFEDVRPDVVFASLSSFGAGIDEAMIKVSKGKVPVFAMQDFWGDANLLLGTPADLYFTIDKMGARLTESRFGIKAQAVGSAKHQVYSKLPIQDLRAEGRRKCGAADGRAVVGFFGQSPEVPEHDRTFSLLVKALREIDGNPMLLVREHPKFRKLHRVPLAELARKSGIDVFDATEKLTPEHWLAAVNVMVTLYSACGLDHAYLSAHSDRSLGTALYIMPFSATRKFVERQCGLVEFPLIAMGLGKFISEEAAVADALRASLLDTSREAYFNSSKCLMMSDPIREILAEVSASVGLEESS